VNVHILVLELRGGEGTERAQAKRMDKGREGRRMRRTRRTTTSRSRSRSRSRRRNRESSNQYRNVTEV
jgi:hypothetical protein